MDKKIKTVIGTVEKVDADPALCKHFNDHKHEDCQPMLSLADRVPVTRYGMPFTVVSCTVHAAGWSDGNWMLYSVRNREKGVHDRLGDPPA